MSGGIKISEATLAALHSLVYLGIKKETIKIDELSTQTGSSIPVLSKVLQYLAKKGFIGSTKGPSGGFYLSKSPEKIRLLDVFEILEGQINRKDCPFNKKKCHFERCIFDNLVKDLNNKFYDYLEKTTVADVIKKI